MVSDARALSMLSGEEGDKTEARGAQGSYAADKYIHKSKESGMERIATGVNGFDTLVEGGLPKGTNILLTGSPGTGKSIFALSYLYSGAMNGENGLYISMDSAISLLKEQARQFGMDIEGLEKQGKIFFLRVPLDKNKLNIFEMIEKVKSQINAKRLVFDSLAAFSINIDLFTIPLGYAGNVASSVSMGEGAASDQPDVGKVFYTGNSDKRMVSLVLEELKSLGTTNLIISFGGTEEGQITMDGVSEYACDGIIQMHNELIGAKHFRTLSIIKMRDTDHSQYVHNVDIGKEGLIVKPAESIM
ncbi:MAG: hypothetical protein KGH61_03020 [Candidatus Micrarchaeota archaeon]|nr:hypothetical protein [Candidatus Micrarchaeota archaeon]MDE1847894.1 hypothetical protein [Candidatus Micrarchaeota archaeon]MDE1864520.1 hypothetical protein [Candidatus Micrarchaeota archaeon]